MDRAIISWQKKIFFCYSFRCTDVPVLNQIEFNPYCVDQDILEYCKENKIIVQRDSRFEGLLYLLNQPFNVNANCGWADGRWSEECSKSILHFGPKQWRFANFGRVKKYLGFQFILEVRSQITLALRYM